MFTSHKQDMTENATLIAEEMVSNSLDESEDEGMLTMTTGVTARAQSNTT